MTQTLLPCQTGSRRSGVEHTRVGRDKVSHRCWTPENTADSGRGLWTRAPKLLDTNLILPHVASKSAVSLFSGFMSRIGNDPVRHPPVRRTRGQPSEEECVAVSSR